VRLALMTRPTLSVRKSHARPVGGTGREAGDCLPDQNY